ncbi:NADH-quinone oxidoreductase subunit A [bacterium]|nr:NADH-quinone oxidoreductase subunit A [bacterium]
MVFPTTIVAYLLLFSAVGFGFVLANLLLGSLLRPKDPNPEKLEIYECGEPTIGSSFVQFDLRFYVVALLFIIFDVEVAFFFPWALVFGKSTQLASPQAPAIVETVDGQRQIGLAYEGLMTEIGLPTEEEELLAAADPAQKVAEVRSAATRLVWTCVADILVFFAVLMVGFAYVWKRGDLDWVRSMAGHAEGPPDSKATWQLKSETISTT